MGIRLPFEILIAIGPLLVTYAIYGKLQPLARQL